MVFSSLLFMFIYLPIVLAIYYLVPVRWRNLWLFVVNMVFYGWGEPIYLILMVFSITINYFCGILIEKYRADDKLARRILTVNTVVNLALLFFFKYTDLFIGSLNSIAGKELIAPLGLSLPIGISFYTFQTMSYPIDVYRGDAYVQKNYISFGTFVCLFPQLIAGPIVRYKDVADQLDFRANSTEQFASGIKRFIIGLGKKVLIANNIGALWEIYSSTPVSELTALGAWMGIIAFTFQIYFDFSGYSDMAIGLGRMLGFEFLENFDYPYISKSVTEFWRRWHISLSTWFRDYVYIPLGGNRKGLARQFINILVVWCLTGFWHGANWTFLLWGLYYAIFLMLEKAFLLKAMEKIPAVFRHLYAILIFTCGWVVFQLDSVAQSIAYYKAMFGFGEAGFMAQGDIYNLSGFGLMFVICAVASTPLGKKLYNALPGSGKLRENLLVPVLIIAVMVVSSSYLVDSTYNPFLYFRF